ncbi:sulfotransferase family protein [Nocardioides jishulii]|uniref:Sulfotransferase family protein n=1 Tax=Nocardioides jishulii TaxID=2575440 RepID=A0A4U2YTW7_9ACTN|nr:sulfotransferase family protein [Nocardioides jishulii]TKI64917.1 sulfotransferase family protein [Nocardioides jishulii]
MDPTEDEGATPRKVLFVAGAGRSGTSTLAGIVSILGMHVPQPEVVADESNPKGFGEPKWCVEQHDRWLAEVNVQVSDARPSAWLDTGRVEAREPARIKVADWLESHFAVAPELVVKDPRLSWFLGLWRVGALRVGADPVFATMLRPPAEVVGSKQKYYANKLGSAHLAAGWVNMLLHTERATRSDEQGGGRTFVRYADLLTDWVRTTTDMAEHLDLRAVLHADSENIRAVHRFVDPNLRRVTVTLADLGLPKRLHELTQETWDQLNLLTDPAEDTPAAHAVLDQLREAYTDLYEESEAIARSTAVAARGDEARKVRARQAAVVEPAPAAPHSLVDLVPHDVRAKIPAGVRRGVRKALGRERDAQDRGRDAQGPQREGQ